jgi:phosphopantothenoylcysteine synthetase/decarboxylase
MTLETSIFKDKTLLLGVSGSIALLGLPSYLSMFTHYFSEVKVIMTESAADLLPISTVELLCAGAYTDIHEKSKQISHVELARWADLFIVLPSTANTLGKAANGLGDNLLTTAILAYPDPILYFPNMNERMWNKKSVQRNIQRLQDDGDKVIPPVKTMAYEVASGTMRPNYTIPSKDIVMNHLHNHLKEMGTLDH